MVTFNQMFAYSLFMLTFNFWYLVRRLLAPDVRIWTAALCFDFFSSGFSGCFFFATELMTSNLTGGGGWEREKESLDRRYLGVAQNTRTSGCKLWKILHIYHLDKPHSLIQQKLVGLCILLFLFLFFYIWCFLLSLLGGGICTDESTPSYCC